MDLESGASLLKGECVYFITDGQAVKIGKTKYHPCSRLAQLQTGNPRELKLITVAYTNPQIYGMEIESFFHSVFRDHRIRGEWYDYDVMNELIDASSPLQDNAHWRKIELTTFWAGYLSEIWIKLLISKKISVN